ncbi:MAG: DUF881 domain-containing protein [Armatimonadota bacterium]|nr:DUF881 domain-containing protein [Armatimonadota bacterium]MDR7498654.1 DUF881 domain-containing protein [Armatimonadota bacterium]MDR7572957.1 DUF881 domain-containing protein [Armatimonadota bacterium]
MATRGRPPVERWQVTLAVFLVLVGFLAVLQVRAGRTIRREVRLPTLRVRELAVLVQQQETALQALEAEIEDLRAKLGEYESAAAQGRSSAETLAREVEAYRMVLGLTPVEGPGVIVRVGEPAAGGGVMAATVQASDLSGLVNELWSSGAEAIAVGGVRILATTGFRQVNDTIVAGIFRLDPPYEIRAIGDPAVMQAALNLRGGFVEGLRSVGLVVEVETSRRLRLPAYRGPLRFRFGRPSS